MDEEDSPKLKKLDKAIIMVEEAKDYIQEIGTDYNEDYFNSVAIDYLLDGVSEIIIRAYRYYRREIRYGRNID